ncbi:hypothetical protein GGD81_002938 [Rhodobium orientis]|uniref:DUF262 domain-containing protein n=1 Tax=Rhodobium orientis TaxID=34017 RepID=A0A327JIL5_9HYPH|nr:DUF262 domain-containing protein [Rhodobium orientis]MBB4303886.1 hypothetical protein [Rhodobium orientis]MBK5951433.1 hypothetical protein [Rhodobium orientis]RAI26139.1 hypothetical protein CH339_15320 [Rhodobium orientis]
MVKKISGAEHPLSKIFSSEFEFVIPPYQRPYAWTVDQVSELLDDLIEFYGEEEEEGYFLGSIVLIKSDFSSYSEVIDGQQRLTTLTIMLSAMASAHCGALAPELKPYILEPGKKMEGIRPKPRLTLRERDIEFFENYIQNFRLDELFELSESSLSNESQINIKLNSKYILNKIEKKFEEVADLEDFVRFLMTRCYLVAVSTPTQESAFRVFSVMNSRGLDLQPTDIIKADVIGKLRDEAARRCYNEKWEEMEVKLTRGGFNDLFSYIRMIFAKEKAKRSLLEEFRKHVLIVNPYPDKLIDDVIEPFSDALDDIRSVSFASERYAEEINRYIVWLKRIDNSDWVPPAMLFLKMHKHRPVHVLRFFQLLERLAAFMHLARYNVNDRIDQYADTISEVEKGLEPDEMDSLYFDRDYAREFEEILDGDIYRLTPRRRNYLVLRLDSFVSDGAATYDPRILTIEHVLPQTVDESSQWADWWPDLNERQRWVHRLANLVPLNKRKNSSAQNYEFSKKCDIYFSGTNNVSSYALTSQVIAQEKWVPRIVKNRQKTLIRALMHGWELERE